MNHITLFVLLVADALIIGFLDAAAVTTTKPSASAAVAGKRTTYKCANCIGKGNDCKGAAQSGCFYCMKIIGVVQGDPKNPILQTFVSLILPGIKVSNYVGQEVTIRKCVTQSDLTTFGYPDREGCGDVSDFSVKGYGCVCKDECKEPTSSKGPSSTAVNTTTAAPKKSAKNATTPAAAKKSTHTPTTPKPKSFFFF